MRIEPIARCFALRHTLAQYLRVTSQELTLQRLFIILLLQELVIGNAQQVMSAAREFCQLLSDHDETLPFAVSSVYFEISGLQCRCDAAHALDALTGLGLLNRGQDGARYWTTTALRKQLRAFLDCLTTLQDETGQPLRRWLDRRVEIAERLALAPNILSRRRLFPLLLIYFLGRGTARSLGAMSALLPHIECFDSNLQRLRHGRNARQVLRELYQGDLVTRTDQGGTWSYSLPSRVHNALVATERAMGEKLAAPTRS